MVGSIVVNGHGSTNMRRVTRKGKVNGSGVSDALAMLGTVVLNVVHDVHK